MEISFVQYIRFGVINKAINLEFTLQRNYVIIR